MELGRKSGMTVRFGNRGWTPGAWAWLFVLAGFGLAGEAAQGARPNILWLVSEDNTTLLGCYGDPMARTPTIDKLAREGITYTRCFAQPGCAPSRFTLITGTFAVSSGPAHHMRADGKIPEWMKGFPAFLRQAGYYTVNNAKTDYNAGISLTETWDECHRTAHYRKRPDPSQPFFAVFNHEVTHESCLFPEKDVPLGFPPTNPSLVRLPPYLPDTPEMRADRARHYDRLALLDARGQTQGTGAGWARGRHHRLLLRRQWRRASAQQTLSPCQRHARSPGRLFPPEMAAFGPGSSRFTHGCPDQFCRFCTHGAGLGGRASAGLLAGPSVCRPCRRNQPFCLLQPGSDGRTV